jgi:hypothetical protein
LPTWPSSPWTSRSWAGAAPRRGPSSRPGSSACGPAPASRRPRSYGSLRSASVPPAPSCGWTGSSLPRPMGSGRVGGRWAPATSKPSGSRSWPDATSTGPTPPVGSR